MWCHFLEYFRFLMCPNGGFPQFSLQALCAPPWHIGLMLPKITNVSKSLRWDLKLTLCENLPGIYWSRTQIGQITHPLALLIKDDDNKSNFSDFCQAQLQLQLHLS